MSVLQRRLQEEVRWELVRLEERLEVHWEMVRLEDRLEGGGE